MMKLGFEWKLALRFLGEGRFQSTLIIAGVTLGVAVIVYITSMLAGLQGNMIRNLLDTQAHIVVRPPDEIVRPQLPSADTARAIQPRAQRVLSIDNWQTYLRYIERVPSIIITSPLASGSALAVRGEATRGITLFGVELERYARIVALRDKLQEGEFRLGAGEALIGVELAKDFALRMGDRFNITTEAVSEPFLVSGILDLGNRQANRTNVYINLHAGQNLLKLPGGITSLELRVGDIYKAETIAQELQAGTGLKVESWMTTNGQLLSTLRGQDVTTIFIRAFVALIVVLGIASVLIVSVVQKQKEIGILRAMGASRGQMTRVFLMQGAIVGVIGFILGSVLAYLLIEAFITFVKGTDGNPIFPIIFLPETALSTCLLAIAAGVIAAIAPARRAAKLDPAQAIRG
ncbi:MAG: ABC transporter permease [Deltaproteobacteria bacterium]|nr:ABC transporter permease [Deltaproteobacteria bacterium]